MTKINLKNIKKIHFIGIGGIGVSAVARMMLGEGKKVSGSNLGESKIIKELEKIGATTFYNHDESHLNPDTDLIVYSPAIPENNTELVKAKKLNIPAITYPQSLGLISENKYTIAVSGTHGKTTTTAMIYDILRDSNFDPTVIVGSLIKGLNGERTNFIKGDSQYFVVEACEYKRSFLQLQPNILVITNIDLDHLDYYKDLADIQSAFRELVLKMKESDFVVCDPDNKNIALVIKDIKAKIIDIKNFDTNKFNLKIPGQYNLENARESFAVGNILEIEQEKSIKSLNNFEGTWRRFEFKGKTKNETLIYDDYAHNPTEVKATLQGAKEFFPDKKITVIFQPHLYSRTKVFLEDFAKSFNDADKVIILPIYAAREENDPTINSQILVDKIKENNPNVSLVKYDDLLNNFNVNGYDENNVIFTIGAGDVYKIGEKLII
ncbi:UDP-N-acetylmuramate--L-alanine ligase [Patescibacteria group bacterium]|nr:UDP-N-acetylmuramate--L-alanine ligase [Patescibacteria group bacterium]